MFGLARFVNNVRSLLCSAVRTHRLCLRRATYRGLAHRLLVAGVSGSLLLSGCSASGKKTVSDLQYLDGEKPISYFKGHNTAIEHPAIDNETAENVQITEEPRSLERRSEDEVREFSLDEAILTALQRNKVAETSALAAAGATRVLQTPDAVSTVYDSAIQETGVLFGRRGLEAALSDFDTRWTTTMNWGRDKRTLHATAPGRFTAETAAFSTGLDKALASGGSVGVFHTWDYLGQGAGTPLYPSTYSGSIGASVRQPLLAGAGTEFTRVAGPVRPGFGAIAGVSQGVVIARINQDITLADFERAVRSGLRDIENAYWDLYLAYRNYDNATATHESAFQSWKESQAKVEVGTGELADELQARDRFYQTRADVELALNELYKSEALLRRMVSLPMNDGTVLRPSTEPTRAEFKPDWNSSIVNGLTQRVELRRQKWQIKSLQLQLNAARSLVRPSLDAVGSYGINGFGDQLISQGGSNGYGSMTGGDDLATWSMGLEMSMPVGLRQARSQARNYELQLARANAILVAQEESVALEIANSMQDVAAAWKAAESNYNRFRAASERLPLLKAKLEIGTTTLDLVLRAEASVAEAERAYYQQLIAYNKAINNLHLATGTILQVNNVHLAEGGWDSEAMLDATVRAHARTHAIDNPNLETAPHEFVSPAPAGSVERRVPVRKATDTTEVPAVPEAPPEEKP
ncbi:MAG: TolC family protein [Planctomycetaceae bacterium]